MQNGVRILGKGAENPTLNVMLIVKVLAQD